MDIPLFPDIIKFNGSYAYKINPSFLHSDADEKGAPYTP